jgi:hypothetical protein
MVHREALIAARGRLADRRAEEFGEPHQRRHGRPIAAGALNDDRRIARLDQALSQLAHAVRIGRRRARDPELLRGRETRALGRQKCDLARQAEIDRAARLGLRDLQRPADDQARHCPGTRADDPTSCIGARCQF